MSMTPLSSTWLKLLSLANKGVSLNATPGEGSLPWPGSNSSEDQLDEYCARTATKTTEGWNEKKVLDLKGFQSKHNIMLYIAMICNIMQLGLLLFFFLECVTEMKVMSEMLLAVVNHLVNFTLWISYFHSNIINIQ